MLTKLRDLGLRCFLRWDREAGGRVTVSSDGCGVWGSVTPVSSPPHRVGTDSALLTRSMTAPHCVFFSRLLGHNWR